MGVKVIIVGGSISGLSLANMLEKFDIDYVLLEGHSTIAPQLGASLGLLPSGLRILDQLGCYERIQKIAGNTYYKASMRLFGGGAWDDPKPVTFSEKLEERIGYPQIFVDRQSVIQVLFDNLKFPERVLTNKRVNRVENHQDKVTVVTKDGSTYTGDFVVGADGIHSTVRQEMWRAAHEEQSNLFSSDPFQDLQCESKCIFGISRKPAALPKSPLQINAFFKNCNYMIISAPEDRIYWFLFAPLDKVFGKDIPKFSKEDERALAEKHFQDRLTDDMLFEDLYENRLQTSLVSTEDHVFPRWHYRRIITIGDAAHKLHPISAQGGNGAMETSAVLTNSLVATIKAHGSDTPLNEEDITAMFTDIQAKRFQRAVDAVNQGRKTNSASIKETVASRIFVNHFFPRFGQSLIFKLVIKNTLTGPVIEDLPLPSRHSEALERHKMTHSRKWPVFWSFISVGVGLFSILLYNHSQFFPITRHDLL
ncbi:FAD/NAD(P)-binding domain-containing protein [Aaosphaeria arxii CBS 175.79]|uniref:FAD/NAD(P)-binding domain-containing protein n=1 Tax=Aaosphaeria arxii CBS 175.79 TaxID=1450172 RepID=A0A6A5XDH1_9PLEO|nr:FAD/NAD(P)-binding domain-containing protein [Aaosphaeria arxii CBS 175.79]KAF2010913.1 FAD/NAD(P)-binding domain-containing protein [Aaosphaeria arxii CBS 175.79]